jgi:putative oxidoreductase
VSVVMAVLRLVIGLLFVGHGAQKLFGAFGGHGPEGTGQFFEQVGLRPGKPKALAAGVTETAGGALLAVGLATPAAVAMLSGVQYAAIWKVHADKGPWVTDGGWEYSAVLLASLMAVAGVGPGPLSLDSVLGMERSGLGWALAATGAGVLGAAAAGLIPPGEAVEEPAKEPEERGAAAA